MARQRREESTFAVDDPTLGQIIRRQFNANLVTRNDADVVLSDFTRGVCEDFGAGVQLDPEPSVGEGLGDRSLDFKGFFFRQSNT